jgi:hypothetical protein
MYVPSTLGLISVMKSLLNAKRIVNVHHRLNALKKVASLLAIAVHASSLSLESNPSVYQIIYIYVPMESRH